MFNLSGSELIFLVIIALVVLGPDKLPEAMRKAGKAYADFKKMTTGFQSEMKSVLDEPMRELRETAELAKTSAMFDTKPFTDSMKDLGNTVTKPAVKPAVKPVSASMAEATPVEAAKPPKATPGPVVGGSAPPLATADAASTNGATAAVVDALDTPATIDDATARRLARSAPPAINVSTTQVHYGGGAGGTGAADADPPVALWPVEPPRADGDGEVPA